MRLPSMTHAFGVTAVAVMAGAVGLFGAVHVPMGQAPPTQSTAPDPRTASVFGQVVDADTGDPIGGAVVRLSMRALNGQQPAIGRGARAGQPLSGAEQAAAQGTDMVLADGDGRFVFHNLPKGPLQLTVTLPGYVEPPGQSTRPIVLAEAQHLSGVKVQLVKTASIAGVLADEAGEPLVGATVRAMRREMPAGVVRYTLVAGANARTDDRGMYRLDGLVPGTYFVVLPQTQTTVPVSTMERNGDMLGGLLSGNNPLVDALTGGNQNALAAPGVRVGDQIWQSSGGGFGGASFASPPPVNGRAAAYQTTFYPGVPQLGQAAAITLKSGEGRIGVDFQVRPSAVARVSGAVVGPDGPAGNLQIRLVNAPGTADDDALAVASTTTAQDGSFTFLGVPTGNYVAKAQQSGRGGLQAMQGLTSMAANLPPQAQQAMQQALGRMGGASPDAAYVWAPVTVGERDVTALTLALKPGAKLSGRIVFEGAAAVPTAQQLSNVQVTLAPANGGSAVPAQPPRLNADLTFKTAAYPPGAYTIGVNGVPGVWMIRSVMAGGRDATRGFELSDGDLGDVVITYTDRIPQVNGTVRTDGGQPLPNATVLLIPGDYRNGLATGALRGQQTAAVQSSGSFTLSRMLPGDYILIAVPDDALTGDRDAAFYDSASRLGTHLTIGEGERKQIELRLVRGLR